VQIECSLEALPEYEFVDPLDLDPQDGLHEVAVGVEREPGRVVPKLPGDVRDQE
jgi:hypothetical protein